MIDKINKIDMGELRREFILSILLIMSRNGRERPSGAWTLVDVAIDTQTTIDNQEHGKGFEYRVIAANRAGESMPSNTVAVVV